MLTFKKLISMLLNMLTPVLVSTILIIDITPLISNASVSISLPKTPKISQQQEIQIIYEALVDDIIQIFKWMEIPGITPSELASKILGYQSDSSRVSLSPRLSYPGLPSFRHEKYLKYRGNKTFSKYLYGRDYHISGFFRLHQEKIEISEFSIYPLNLNSLNLGKINENWHANFSAINFMNYLSIGIEKIRTKEIGYHDGYPGSPSYLYQTIDLKQKYFKLSKFQKYIVTITSLPTGAWQSPNGEELLRQRTPYITLQLDPK
jgi:hypothetical protein